MRRRSTCAVLLSTLAGSLGAAGMAEAAPPEQCPISKSPYQGGSPRFHRASIDIGGVAYRFTVLLPSDYDTSNRRYPVLYLYHGGGGHEESFMGTGAKPPLIETISARAPVIVVMPDGGHIGGHSDWPDDSHQQWETFHISRLIPHIDATYRTLPTPRHRAAFGYSMGGYGAMKYAGRHPGVFGAAGSASGFPDITRRSPGMQAALVPILLALRPLCTRSQRPLAPLGDPVTEYDRWEAHSPSTYAERMRGTLLYATSGNGVPCDAEDPVTVATHVVPDYTYAIEAQLRESNDSFHAVLVEAGIDHIYRTPGCGVHSRRYFETALRDWWPIMMRFFGDASKATKVPVLRLRVQPDRVTSGRRTTLRLSTSAVIGGVRRPVSGAGIRLGRKRAITGQRGRARIRVLLREPGRRRIVASRDGVRHGVAHVRVTRALDVRGAGARSGT